MATRKPLYVTTAQEVFELLDGIDGVERLTGAGRTSVFNWRAWGYFPARYRDVMRLALERKRAVAPAALWGQQGNFELAA